MQAEDALLDGAGTTRQPTARDGKNTAQSMWINNACTIIFSIGMLGSAMKPPETLRHSVYLMCTDITLVVS